MRIPYKIKDMINYEKAKGLSIPVKSKESEIIEEKSDLDLE